jgi:hypothetical protein
MVRARARVDLERLIEKLPQIPGEQAAEILDTPTADYPFRIFVERSVWAAYLASAAWNMDYTNFKARAAVGAARSSAYHAVWSRMIRFQYDEAAGVTSCFDEEANLGLQEDLFDVEEDLDEGDIW